MDQQGLRGAAGRGRRALVTGFAALVTATTTLLAGLPGQAPPGTAAGTVDWAAHGANAAHTQSSPLDQITPANVATLEVAWTYHTGDARPGRSQIQCNPIVVRGVLYATSPQLKVFALDAATGQQKWVFDPFTAGADQSGLGVNRGVVYWEGEGGRDARILVGAGFTLFAHRRGDRPADRELRQQGRRRSARRPRRLGEVALRPRQHARHDLQGPADPGHARRRGPGPVGAGLRARLQRPHRRHRLDVPHHPAARRAGPRDLAGRCLEARRRRQLVERRHRRCRARPGVPADRIGGVRLLGRQPQGRQPLREQPAGAEGRHRRLRLALPVRPPRHLGSRSAAGARAGDRAARRPLDPGGGAGDQDRPRLRVRSRDRRAAVPDGGTGRCRRPISRARSRRRRSRCRRRRRRSRGSCSRKTRSPTCRPRRRPACASAGWPRSAAARGRRRARRARSSSPASTAAPSGADPPTTSAPACST